MTDVDVPLRSSEILLVFLMKGKVLHCEHVHSKVPAWLSDFSVLPTRKLP